jgi:hypothetical protein
MERGKKNTTCAELQNFGKLRSGNDAELTHPVYASLDHPLFTCGGKRGFSKIVKKVFYPLSGEAEERVVQRSVDRVSICQHDVL